MLLQFMVLRTPLFLDLLICSMKKNIYIYIVVCKVHLILKACKSSKIKVRFCAFLNENMHAGLMTEMKYLALNRP